MKGATASRPVASMRRYSRHLLIPEVGVDGQRKLAGARVLCVGAGGLGSPVLAYLTAAGIGRIGIIDDDTVDETNLQRQIIYREADVGKPKAEVAAGTLQALNSQVAFDVVPVRLTAGNARELIRLYDVVVDCTDSFATRYLINDACVLEGVPDVYGSIFRFEGQVSVFAHPGGPCLRCMFPIVPAPGTVPTCAEGGVLGVLAGLVGTLQANEALKLLLGVGEPLVGKVALVGALDAQVRTVRIRRDPECEACGEHPVIDDVHDHREAADSGLDREQARIEVDRLDDFLAEDADAVVLDVREPHEAVLGAHPRAVAVPASTFEHEMHRLDSSKTYVVACRIGQVSLWACRRLRDAGFKKVLHLEGGLLRYAAYQDNAFDAF